MDSPHREAETVVADPAPAVTPFRVAVVGCGLIGRRRAEVVRRSTTAELVIVADLDGARAGAVAREAGCLATTDWQAAATTADVDIVVVSTTNNWLAPVTIAALRHGKHVLVEKPMARTVAEAEAIAQAAGYLPSIVGSGDCRQTAFGGRPPLVRVGFNHRHHAALWQAHDLFARGAIGDVLSIRCRYGHGGRPGYDKEWRADPALAGGGELLDQGVHAIDLFRWFLGDFAEAVGFTASYVWGAGGAVEDNAFALFRTATGRVASLHASWTQWKNLFCFEVFGRDGYLLLEGLGGSYGPERLTWGRRRPESGPPDEQRFDFPALDISWDAEWQEFVDAIRAHREPLANGYDGLQAIRMVHAVYESSRTGRVVEL